MINHDLFTPLQNIFAPELKRNIKLIEHTYKFLLSEIRIQMD